VLLGRGLPLRRFPVQAAR